MAMVLPSKANAFTETDATNANANIAMTHQSACSRIQKRHQINVRGVGSQVWIGAYLRFALFIIFTLKATD